MGAISRSHRRPIPSNPPHRCHHRHSHPAAPPIPRRNASSKRLFASASRCEKPYLFSGRFTPIRPTDPRCERKGLRTSCTRSTWVLHRPPGHCSPASRPTPHAGTSGGQVMRKPSPAGISVTDRRIAKDRTGPDLDEHPPILLCHRTRRFLRTNQTILPLPARRRRTVDHSLVAGSAQRHQFQACLPNGHQPQCLSFP